ncbi:S-4TM family putative pore-forming effector [Solicola sp. PLA-1-18]|uniref:S-4TM family putative pore-forming effector n=1 Tax=Solicola sp. PLA-1-18 TaxID=3380532 RepID=UPI003B8216BF
MTAEPSDDDPTTDDEAEKYDPGPINQRQETPHAQRFLKAQSRLYSDAENIRKLRLPVTAALAGLSVLLGLALPDARTVIGVAGVVVSFLWSVLAFVPERRRRNDAVATQEEFDCYVYDLPWKPSAVDHPSATTVAEAAERYEGERMARWYPRTGPLPRPFDILVCQRSNLGWGTASHRQYSAFLIVILLALVAVTVLIGWLVDDGLLVVLPLLAPVQGVFELSRDHRTSADDKEKAEAKVRQAWEGALVDPATLSIADCRDIQDRILSMRAGNASVPDWFDNWRRNTYEASMRQSTNVYIEQAVQANITN